MKNQEPELRWKYLCNKLSESGLIGIMFYYVDHVLLPWNQGMGATLKQLHEVQMCNVHSPKPPSHFT